MQEDPKTMAERHVNVIHDPNEPDIEGHYFSVIDVTIWLKVGTKLRHRTKGPAVITPTQKIYCINDSVIPRNEFIMFYEIAYLESYQGV